MKRFKVRNVQKQTTRREYARGIIKHVITASCLEELTHRTNVLGEFSGSCLTLFAIFLSHNNTFSTHFCQRICYDVS